MTIFRVWAPGAGAVDLLLGGERIPLVAEVGGWWHVERPAPAGERYTFSVDGSEPLPDPRSPYQPEGPFGPSAVVDHDAFPWTDTSWQSPPLASAVIYELHIGVFSVDGTFDGAIPHLDHLVELGVTHIELMPVHEFPGERGWGYDGVDLFAPHNTYGGPDGLKRLVNACHARGLAVLMDVVYNHLGPSGNFLSRFGPYFTDRYETPWGQAINLDQPRADEVRRFFCDNALMWLRDYHCDGLRLDATHEIIDTSAMHFIEQLQVEVDALEAEVGRRFTLIAESDLNDPRLIRPPEAGGYGLAAQWSDDFHHAVHALLTGERAGYYVDYGSPADLAHALEHGYVYEGQYSVARQRRHGRPTLNPPGQRFVVCTQNHDQVGNRAGGDRSAALLSVDRLKIAAALLCLSPFTPLIFQGEEWAASTPFLYFTDHSDPALAQAITEGRRREFAAFGWRPEDIPDPQAPGTFERSKLKWAELTHEPHADVYAWYRSLLRLRRSEPALANGRLQGVRCAWDDVAGWFRLCRGPIALLFNLSDETQRIPLPVSADWRPLLSTQPDAPLDATGATLQPDGCGILRRQ